MVAPKHSLRDLDDAHLEPVVETMFLAARADGEFAPEEREVFVKSAAEVSDGRLSNERVEEIFLRAQELLATSDRDARLAAVRAGLPTGAPRLTALAMAVRVVAADGIIRTTERELLLEIAEALEIDRDEAANLVRELSRPG